MHLHTATSGATIFYTLNGTAPTHNGGSETGTTKVYSDNNPINIGKCGVELQFRAIAYKSGMTDSDEANFTESSDCGTCGGGGGQAPQSASIASPVVYSVWDGDWALLEEYGADNTLIESYVQGYHGLVKTVVAGIYYYQDSLGSTSHIADANGNLLEWYRYDLYGKPTYWSASTPTSQLPSSNFGVRDLHGGTRWMPELGLYDDRNRFMSPELGRFLQPDPIGFKGDASNLYRYCGNDWANRTDPMGLEGGVTAMVSDLARWAAKIEREKPDSRKDFAHMPLEQYHVAMQRGAIATARINNDIARRQTFATRVKSAIASGPRLAQAGRGGNVPARRTVEGSGNLAIDTDGSGPSHGDRYHRNETSYQPNGRSLNADTDPYVAVPTSTQRLGVRAGDEAVLSGNGRSTGGVVGDFGSPGWGEASPAMARGIGIGTRDMPGGVGPVPDTPGGRPVPVTITVYPSGEPDR